jgi:hypothetical protein
MSSCSVAVGLRVVAFNLTGNPERVKPGRLKFINFSNDYWWGSDWAAAE